MRKVLLSVAPVCHETVTVPQGVKVPYTPEEVAREMMGIDTKDRYKKN